MFILCRLISIISKVLMTNTDMASAIRCWSWWVACCRGSVRTVGEREPDIVGRLGGEEFGILLSTESLDQAHSVAERIRATLEKSEVETGAHPLTITGSFGLAEAKSGESLDDLYHRADAACYEAKRNGRNQVVVAS